MLTTKSFFELRSPLDVAIYLLVDDAVAMNIKKQMRGALEHIVEEVAEHFYKLVTRAEFLDGCPNAQKLLLYDMDVVLRLEKCIYNKCGQRLLRF